MRAAGSTGGAATADEAASGTDHRGPDSYALQVLRPRDGAVRIACALAAVGAIGAAALGVLQLL